MLLEKQGRFLKKRVWSELRKNPQSLKLDLSGSLPYLSFYCAPVAQGIGRQPPELKIVGSNPTGRTIIKTIS